MEFPRFLISNQLFNVRIKALNAIAQFMKDLENPNIVFMKVYISSDTYKV